MTPSPSDCPDGSQGTTTLGEGDRNRLLASRRRRLVLDVIEDRSTPIGLGTLARAIGTAEFGSEAIEPETIERLSISLHHNHLPRLDDVGALDYDAVSNHVSAVGNLPIR